MKNKAAVIILYIIQAIPTPISLITLLGSAISLANIRMMGSAMVAVISVIAMILAGTYTITYAISLAITIKKKRVGFYSFLPVLHVMLAGLFVYLWSYVETLV